MHSKEETTHLGTSARLPAESVQKACSELQSARNLLI
jgi:hypothetical protein